jgi:hypothetical protein
LDKIKLLSFKEVIKIADESGKKRHLLLGNGFSIACYDKFKYGTLAEQAKMKKLPLHLKELLDGYGNNFEEVMRLLDDGARLVRIYELLKKKGAKKDIEKDYNLLKKILIEVITDNHPSFPSVIPDSKFESCLSFISNFDDVYSLNYDLLLYWASLHVKEGEDFPFSDGFERGEEPEGTDCYFAADDYGKRRMYFLHGGLHLYTEGGRVWKRVWQGKEITIIDQVKEAFETKKYPLFIAEGKTIYKQLQIEKSSYLSYALRRFNHIQGNLVIFGHSLCEQDEHIIKNIEGNLKVINLFVGIFGDPASSENARIIERALLMQKNRKKKTENYNDLNVYFFDSSSAKVWDGIV